MTGMLSKLTDALAQKKVVIFSLAVTAVLILIINRIDSRLSGSGGLEILFLQIAFTSKDFDTVLASWGTGGIDYYVQTIWIDYLYALSAAFLLSSATAYFRVQTRLLGGESVRKRDGLIFILPLVYALLEMAENTLHIFIIVTNIFREPAVLVSSLVSILKYIFLLLGIGVMMRHYFKFREMIKSQGRQ